MSQVLNNNRIDGSVFWLEAKAIVADFANVANTMADEYVAERGLNGPMRFVSKVVARHKIMNAQKTFMTVSLTRVVFGSKVTAKDLLKTLAGLKEYKLG